MIWLLLAYAITADLPPGTALPAPNEIQIIRFDNRDQVFYGSIEEKGNQVTVIYDTPWNPQPVQSLAKGNITWEPEAPSNREQRLLEQGRKAGYTLADTSSGQRWLPTEAVTLSKRARAMAEAVQPVTLNDAPAVAQAVANTTPPAAAAPARPFVRYAVQGLIALVGLVAAGLCLRYLVFA